MKKQLLLITTSILALSNIYCKKNSNFIDIESAPAIIGNDSFKITQREFTGVHGEKNKPGIKYLLKEHEIFLDEYKISKYLITNEEFYTFRKETGYKSLYEIEKDVSGDYVYNGILMKSNPVKRITLLDAIAYCQWYSDNNNVLCRLPTNAEWEYSALKNQRQLFPWGNDNKILKETLTDKQVKRDNYSVYEITEDSSPLGICNLMGGCEYTLDCYDDSFYENSPKKKPLCLIPKNAMNVMRGIPYYNEIETNSFGLYELTWNSISSWNGFSYFRTVIDCGTIFNKDTMDESVYFVNIGEIKNNNIKIYTHPDCNSESESITCESKLYILFKSTKNNYYRVFLQTYEKNILGNICKTWKIGWVNGTEISLTNEKWYKTNLYE